MSIAARGLGQPEEGALVAGGITAGSGTPPPTVRELAGSASALSSADGRLVGTLLLDGDGTADSDASGDVQGAPTLTGSASSTSTGRGVLEVGGGLPPTDPFPGMGPVAGPIKSRRKVLALAGAGSARSVASGRVRLVAGSRGDGSGRSDASGHYVFVGDLEGSGVAVPGGGGAQTRIDDGEVMLFLAAYLEAVPTA